MSLFRMADIKDLWKPLSCSNKNYIIGCMYLHYIRWHTIRKKGTEYDD